MRFGRAARWLCATIALAVAALLTALVPGAADAARSSTASVSWGQAEVLPGLEALIGSGSVDAWGQRCSSVTRCSAYGVYLGHGTPGVVEHLFIDEMVGGTWGLPEEVPGLSTVEGPGGVQGGGVECRNPGDCVAYGSYDGTGTRPLAFVVDETDGSWGPPTLLGGLTMATEGATVWRVECAAIGSCAAIGDFQDARGVEHPFVATEAAGVWQPATALAGLPELSSEAYDSYLSNVDCFAIGDCLATGFSDRNANGDREVFTAEEHDGSWLPARRIPWLVARDTGGLDQVSSVACPRSGWCTIGGFFETKGGRAHYFVQSQRGGVWAAPMALDVPAFAPMSSPPSLKLQCPAVGRCDVTGIYADSDAVEIAFVSTVVNGLVGPVTELADPVTHRVGRGHVSPGDLSCSAFDACGLAVNFTSPGGATRVAVSNRLGRRWSPLTQVSTFASFDPGQSDAVTSVECLTPRYCVAVGSYELGVSVFVTH